MITALAYGAAYSLVGIALLVAGFYVLDLLTPGRLARHLTEGAGSFNAGVLVAAEFLGLGAILFTAIWTNADSFGPALGWTVGFGVVGIALQAVSLLVLDAVTPVSLRRLVVDPGLHPAVLATAAAQLAVSAIIVASIA